MATTRSRPPSAAPPPPAVGASTVSMRSPLVAWLANHRAVAEDSLRRLMAEWLQTAFTWLMLGIALALPVLLLVLLENVAGVAGAWDGQARINVFLRHEVSAEDGAALAREMEQWEEVAGGSYIDPADALREFESRSGFSDVLDGLDRNPLPGVILVRPAVEPVGMPILLRRLEGLPDVDSVAVDLAWLERLRNLIALGERIVVALAATLALGVVLIIGNTIRLAIENRRAEIEVVKLVGGTDGFVRRPFLYLGLWFGLGGALVAWLVSTAGLLFLDGPVARLAGSYGGQYALSGLGLGGSLLLLALGAILGVLGAFLAVRQHLDAIEPQ